MKNDKILITINDKEDIKKYEKLGIKHYVFPLQGFCVGMPNTFLISEIPENSYILINRILDNEGIDNLKKILNDLKKMQGIIFDDLGVLEVIKDLEITKILYLTHFNNNIESIKIYLNYVDSVFISSDITREEMKGVVKNIPSKLTIFVLGFTPAMYSRRLLIDNYTKYHKIKRVNPLLIENTNYKFLVYENEFGTYFYHYPLFNGLELLNMDASYYFINSAFLKFDDIKDLLNGNSNLEYDNNFLEKETIFKLKGDING